MGSSDQRKSEELERKNGKTEKGIEEKRSEGGVTKGRLGLRG